MFKSMNAKSQTALVLLLLFFFGLQSANAKGPVWKISDGENELLIGGTIHLLAESDYPLPSVFKEGYAQAELLVFEIDPDEARSPQAQMKFVQYAMYQDGRSLKTVLSDSLYSELSDFLASRGQSISVYESFKPSMLSAVLTLLELQRLGIAGMGVDEFYNERAKQDNKQRLFLETIDDQFKALLSSGEGNEDTVIRQSLDELKKMPEMMKLVKEAWRQGDNTELSALALAPWQNEFPALYKSLLVDRNQRWVPQIISLMETKEVEYILVGALHLVGDDGLLSLLKAKGFKVEQLQ